MELNQGTQLQNGKYRIISLLMQDDTVISYQAMCKMVVDGAFGKFKTDVEVVLKEFFLRNYCSRGADGMVVTVDQANKKLIESSKQNFKAMAENLASMNDPDGTAQVTDIFEENGTIYYVAPIKEGRITTGQPAVNNDAVPKMPPQPVRKQAQPMRSMDTQPAEVGYGYENEDKRKKRSLLYALLALAVIAIGVAAFLFLNKGSSDSEFTQDTTDPVPEMRVDSTDNAARNQVAKDVADINKNLPNALNNHIIMESAEYDKDKNVLTITYKVTDKTDLAKQKDEIREGMLSGLKSNDGTGRHFREALITVREYFKMNGVTVDQFELTPEDYSKIKI